MSNELSFLDDFEKSKQSKDILEDIDSIKRTIVKKIKETVNADDSYIDPRDLMSYTNVILSIERSYETDNNEAGLFNKLKDMYNNKHLGLNEYPIDEVLTLRADVNKNIVLGEEI